MNKIIGYLLIGSVVAYSVYGYNGSTSSVVTLVGSIVKSHQTDNTKKYKRKDCPVCKGTGWYRSGDGLEKVPCGYCEEDENNQKLRVFKK